MTYSCTDFTSDVLRCLVEVDALDPTVMTGDDLGAQSDLAVDAIFSLHRRGANLPRRADSESPDDPERVGHVRIHNLATSTRTYAAVTIVIADLHLSADLVSDRQIRLAKTISESHGASFVVSDMLKDRVDAALNKSAQA